MATERDPETQRLVRESLTLVIRSEKLLTQLQDHLDMLRTYVGKQDDGGEADDNGS